MSPGQISGIGGSKAILSYLEYFIAAAASPEGAEVSLQPLQQRSEAMKSRIR